MKTNYSLFLNLIHGLFLGFVLGLTVSLLTLEFLPEIQNYIHPSYIYPILSLLGAAIGYIKGINNYRKLLFFLFSTLGTILLPIIAITTLYFLLGFDRLLALPPIIFKTGIGLRGMDTRLSSYLLTTIASMSFVGALISSFSINKNNRWTF